MKQVIALTAAAVAASAAHHSAPGTTEAIHAPPDRLSVDTASPHFDPCYRRVGVKFNGLDRQGDVQEYCVSEGWIDVRQRGAGGKFMVESDGTYRLSRLHGEVVAYFRHGIAPAAPDRRQTPEQAAERIAAAEAKRARKAEKLKKQMGGA